MLVNLSHLRKSELRTQQHIHMQYRAKKYIKSVKKRRADLRRGKMSNIKQNPDEEPAESFCTFSCLKRN